jgi:hypothetical protein
VPSRFTAKLNPIATEYLRNLDDLEAARDIFIGERAKVLDDLGTILLEEAGEQKQPIASSRRNDTYGTFDVDITAEYVAVRAAEGKKRSSGYSAVVGSFLGHVGAQALLWFNLKLTPSKHKTLQLGALAAEFGAGANVLGEGMWLYIRTALQPAANLDLEALSDDVRRLPGLFAKADPWIAKRWLD